MGCSVSGELSASVQDDEVMTHSPLAGVDRAMIDNFMASPTSAMGARGVKRSSSEMPRTRYIDRRPKAVDTSYASTYNTVARERRRLSRRDCPLFWLEDVPDDVPTQSVSG